ncbi:hypothetical protein [Aestuariibacter salexigens]|uniref:hypothetical protein n=1 Tax=Aestuariibacter salexigens TaxID=226010 RepID=UPI0004793304|nr:hypothetical protein [Aestuariibacter salexigens]
MFTIIIILIVTLIVAAIIINAMQQHKEKVEAEKRTEIAKQRSIVDETENVLMAAGQMPISQKVISILQTRVNNALRVMYELNPSQADIKQRIKDADDRLKSISLDEPTNSQDSFVLPDNDKMIIQYIQAIKKLRVLLRSEHTKGKVDTQTFMREDKTLEKLQLRVNVETLVKRGAAAMNTNMLGSARQYFEKAIAALDAQTQPDDYVMQRKQQLQEQLQTIQDNLRNVNAQDRAKKQAEERDELDELFAPKKKW